MKKGGQMRGTREQTAFERFKAMYLPRYAGDLAECERRLSSIAGRSGGVAGDACQLTLSAGGKRLRPLLVFLASARGTSPGDAHYGAAAAVELVHMATLVHDDVLDGAELRRGKPTVAAAFGAAASIAAGDFLFSAAFEAMAGTGSARAVSQLSSACLDLSLGELAQRRQTADIGLSRDDYLVRCRLKTSRLFETACQAGAILSGCRDETVAAVGEFGRLMGISFQISDDVLDFAGEQERTGKRPGADLRDGTVTLPLIIAMKRDAKITALLADAYEGSVEASLPTDGVVDEICRRVADCGALDEALSQGSGFVSQARAALAAAGDELETEPLEMMAEATLERRF